MDFSVVIPVHNERPSLPRLYEEISDVLDGLDRDGEVIWVDDGSDDGTGDWLEQRVNGLHKLVRLRTNYGQSSAMGAGAGIASGDIVLFMDGDGQQDPADIPDLLEQMDEPDVDLVSGWRTDRKDPWLTRIFPSRIANFIISLVTGVKLHDYGCTLKAYQSRLIKNMPLYGEFHRFLPAMASWYGARIREIPVQHRARESGSSHYGLGRIPGVLLDLIVVKFLLDYGFRPIRIFGWVGFWLMGLAGASVGYLAYLRLVINQSLSDHALTTITVMLVLMAMMSLILGLLGEQISRFYEQSSSHQEYRILRRVGFTGDRGERQSNVEGQM